MKDDDTNKPGPEGAVPTPPKRKLPYEAPAVISEEVFETLALSCTRAFGCSPGNRS